MISPNFSKTKKTLGENWKIYLLYLLSVVALILLYTFRLSSLTRQLANPIEQQTLLHGMSWHHILADPLNAPYAITVRLLSYLHGGLFILRLASVLWSFIAIKLFFTIVRRLHGQQIATIGTILFATSAWLLHIGRFAGPDITILCAGLGILLLFLRKKDGAIISPISQIPALYFLTILVVSILYIPGMIWLIILAAILRIDVVKITWRSSGNIVRITSVLGGIILLAPLARAGLKHTSQFITDWLNVSSRNLGFGHLLHQFISVPDNLFWHGPQTPVLWLGRLPIIELATTILAIVGSYYYLRRIKQTRLLVFVPVLSWILIIFGAANMITLIVAFVYIYASGGIAYTLRLWQKVFPRNPIARVTALVFISSIVGLIALYNVRQYFVAWGYSDVTQDAYQQKL